MLLPLAQMHWPYLEFLSISFRLFKKCSLQINLPKLSQIPRYSWCHRGNCTCVDCPQWLFVHCLSKYICEWLLHTSIITKVVISTVHEIILENLFLVNLYKYTCSGLFLQCCMRFLFNYYFLDMFLFILHVFFNDDAGVHCHGQLIHKYELTN